MFTGDEFADGGEVIRATLRQHKILGSFFLTGNFYAKESFRTLIAGLKEEGHYLGAHSDKHLLYADWKNRDSLLVNREEFKGDLLKNYNRMLNFGVKWEQAPYFLPPFEWYNRTISRWTHEMGLKLLNFSPGTYSTADYTYPEMGDAYRPTDQIYQSIIDKERTDENGLNGFILLVHIGTDPRRTDKFYHRLDKLIRELKSKGYSFGGLNDLIDD